MSKVKPLPAPAALGKILVTGGSGFLGSNLVQTLLDKGYSVRSFDRIKSTLEHPNLEVTEGDICEKESVLLACEGIDTIFHTAAIIEIRSSRIVPEATRQLSYDINLGGTKNLVESALVSHVKRLVYTSSNSVVIDGQPIVSGNESMPYVKEFRDLYTETKTKAEKLVLAANGIQGLYTCAIRPSGIWGPGDQTMFRKMIEQLVKGSFKALVGDGSARLDNSYVHNLIHGQILAAEQLSEQGNASGQAYFINDAEPINMMEFSKPLVQALGYPYPNRRVSYRLVRQVFQVWEKLHLIVKAPESPQSLLALERIGIDNYFSTEKARNELGYTPLYSTAQAMAEALPYYRKLHEEIKAKAS